MYTKFVYVADDHMIVSLQGIRYVTKTDDTICGGDVRYYLEVVYKGNAMRYRYLTHIARDAQYEKIRAALCPSKE